MPRKSQFTATISKSGYKTVDIAVTNKISTGGGVGMAGNVLVGGIIGAGVDVASGAMLDLTPNPVNIVLEKQEGSGMATPPSPPPSAPLPPPPAVTNGTPAPAATPHR